MLFAIRCLDRNDGADLREATGAAHSAYMKARMAAIVFGGPLMADDGKTRIGTLIVVDMATRVDVDAFLAHEPYKRAGLFAHCEVYPYQLIVERGQPCQ